MACVRAAAAPPGLALGLRSLQENERERSRTPLKSLAGPIGTILRQCRRSLALVLVLTLIADVLALTPVIYMLNIYDRVLLSRSGSTLVSLLLIVMLVFLFWSAIDWIRNRLLVRVSLRIDWDVAAKVFDASFRRHVLRRNVNVHRALANLVTVRQFITGHALTSLMSLPFVLIYVVLGALFHPYLAVFALCATALMLVTALGSQKLSAPVLRRANDASAEANRIAAFSLRHAETAQALGMQGAIRQRWYERHRSFLGLQVQASEASGILGGFSGVLRRCLPSLQLSLAAWLAIEGLITGGMVIAASVLLSRSISPINTLVLQWKDVVTARQAYDELQALLTDEEAEQQPMKLPAPSGRLSVSDATAVPPGKSAPVVSSINFSVEPGQTVAVVGPSASGKTSLTKLLIGVWRPGKGSVRLDGAEISDWNHQELGAQIGYVPQEIEFFEGTVAENIARLSGVDPEKVVQAAKLIDAHELILKLPKGYETVLGESGHALSAGQRQRIAMARAFYGTPRYIVMDEPNAHLDDAGEQALGKALAELKRAGCTVIITTHRPRLIGVVDDLLVLRDGAQLRFGAAEKMLAEVRKMRIAAADHVEMQPRGV
jgi:PrtD family type I secretion system ABC transporter